MANSNDKNKISNPLIIKLILIIILVAIFGYLILIMKPVSTESEKTDKAEVSETVDKTEAAENELEQSNNEDERNNTIEPVDHTNDGSIEFKGKYIYPDAMFASNENAKLISILATSREAEYNQSYNMYANESKDMEALGISTDLVENCVISYKNDLSDPYTIVIAKVKDGKSDEVKESLEDYKSTLSDKFKDNKEMTDMINKAVISDDVNGFRFMAITPDNDDTVRVMTELLNRIDEIQVKSSKDSSN